MHHCMTVHGSLWFHAHYPFPSTGHSAPESDLTRPHPIVHPPPEHAGVFKCITLGSSLHMHVCQSVTFEMALARPSVPKYTLILYAS